MIYVFGIYANTVDVVNLNWSPILEGIKYNTSKPTYQGLNDKSWLSYLLMEIVKEKRTLDHVLITVENIRFKIKLKTLSTNCQLIFDQMRVKKVLTGKQRF